VSAFFVTATGTDAGKTYVVELLIGRWLQDAREVRAIKPVISGFDPENPASSDTGTLLTAMGKELTPAAIDGISPWRYAAPLSPDMAAARENRYVPFDDVVAFCREQIEKAERLSIPLLIEGIGGVMVPLDENRTILDLIAALEVPAILVCGTYLGSLSHTLTAFAALRNRDISIDRIIVNETPGDAVALTEVQKTIMRFTRDVPVETLPFRPPPLTPD
jgi:dethiobiotin synthetase